MENLGLKNKNTLIFVHGYNNEQFEGYDAYQIIENQIKKIIPGIYDYVINYSWPGGDQLLEWWQVKTKSNSIARVFRFLIEALAGTANSLDMMTHSLGKSLGLFSKNKLVAKLYNRAAPLYVSVAIPALVTYTRSISYSKNQY